MKFQKFKMTIDPTPKTDMLISHINSSPALSWKADICMLSKSHSLWDPLCDLKAFAQKKKKTKKYFGDKTIDFQEAVQKAQKFHKKYSNPDQIPSSEIPALFTFTDIGGYDFTTVVREQQHCGSCYVSSFVSAAEIRQQMLYGKPVPELSMQFLLSCNYMNEGCEGGWPIFNGYLAENGYLVSEDCAPYQQQTFSNKCSQYASCPPVAAVKQSYFLGGGFGQYRSAVEIQKEILFNGPVVANIKAPHYFLVYKEGILVNDESTNNKLL